MVNKTVDTDFIYEGFEELEASGFISDYIHIDHSTTPSTIKPAFTLESILNDGFKPKGTKLRFLNANGYDGERLRAAETFDQQKEYTVKTCNVGNSSSNYTFEEVEGSWNTVMFGEGQTIVQYLQWLVDSQTKNGLNDLASSYQKELEEYKDATDFQLTNHIGCYAGSYMMDEYVCSCGWKSGPFWDGAEYASKDWMDHVKKVILTPVEWPIP